jgi:hypothetical protein
MWRDWLNFNVSMTRRPRHSPPRFSLYPARPECPLWSGDGLGASGTILGRAGQKERSGRGNGAKKYVWHAPKSFGDATGDALRTLLYSPVEMLQYV